MSLPRLKSLKAMFGYGTAILIVVCCPLSAFAQESDNIEAQDDLSEPQSNDQETAQQEGELLFLDPDGKPLPPEVQAQLRESFRASSRAETEDSDAIVVRSRRPRGSIEFDLAPERSFSPLELRAFGAGNVNELIDALDAQVSSLASGEEGQPILLLNGRRVVNPLDIATIPTEAIERVDLFDEQLAAQYGFRSDVKVVNIVTYESYSALTALGLVSAATEGGYASGNGSFDLFSINKDTRYGIGIDYARTGNLTEAERGVLQPTESFGLAPFRTLLPQTEKVSVNGNVARPLGERVGASLTGRYEYNDSSGLAGTIGGSVVETRLETQQLAVGIGVSTQIDRFLLSLNSSYFNFNETASVSTREDGRLIDSSELDKHIFAGDLRLAGPLAELPGGFVSVAATIGGGTSQINADALSAVSGSRSERVRDTGRLSFSVNLPISAPESSLGRLSTGFDFGASTFSDVRDTRRLAANISWSPIERVRLGFAFSSEQRAPALEQLGQPTLLSLNVRTLDFIIGETVDVDLLAGGNDQLQNEEREELRFRFSYQPFKRVNLSLIVNFYSTKIEDPIASFPLLTEATASAFPSRFGRDADGTLSRIDVRPLNFEKSSQDRFLWGLSFSRPLGPVGLSP